MKVGCWERRCFQLASGNPFTTFQALQPLRTFCFRCRIKQRSSQRMSKRHHRRRQIRRSCLAGGRLGQKITQDRFFLGNQGQHSRATFSQREPFHCVNLFMMSNNGIVLVHFSQRRTRIPMVLVPKVVHESTMASRVALEVGWFPLTVELYNPLTIPFHDAELLRGYNPKLIEIRGSYPF